MWIYLGLHSSVPLIYVCFYANIILFWLLEFYNIVWSQSTWCLQLCCSKIALAIWSLWVKVNFRSFSISVKNAIGILIGVRHDWLNWTDVESTDYFVYGDILTIFSLLIHSYRISLQLVVSSVSFINIWQFSVYQSFTSLV